MIILVLVLLGLCLGSFVNALVWRLHEQENTKGKRARAALSISKGRSMCPDCHHQLGPRDLLPVISWLALGGRCHYCRKPISWQYPVVEVLTAGLFVFSYLYWPYDWSQLGLLQFGVWLVVLTAFMALAVYDLRWMLLPTRLLRPLGAFVAAEVAILAIWQHNSYIVSGAALGALCLAGLFYALFTFSKGAWIGGGDVRLAVVLGMLVSGPVKALLVLFFASFFGSLYAVPLLAMGKKKLSQRVPFGPFLLLATVVVYLFGTALVTWYKRQFLLL